MYQQLQYDDRLYIQIALEDFSNNSLIQVAKHLHRSKSTIYREIITKSETTKPVQLIINGRLSSVPICPYLKKWPYVCNGCGKVNCSKEKRIYNAYSAHYLTKLRVSNAARRLKRDSAKKIQIVEEKIVPILSHKISVEIACSKTHTDISPSTIRDWINNKRLSINRIDLPRAAKFYNKKLYEVKRKENTTPARVLYSRTINKYHEFIASNKCNQVQLDTVIGKNTDKYAILTIYEVTSKFQFGFRIKNTAIELNKQVENLWQLFESLDIKIGVILTDNGKQMQQLPNIELNECGVVRFKVFYCDPYCSCQKAECERNHVFVRYGLKKGESIDEFSNSDIIDLFSKVNSYPRKSLGWKTPFEAFCHKFPKGQDALNSLGYKLIPIEQLNFKK